MKTALKTDEIQKNRNEMTAGKCWIYAEMYGWIFRGQNNTSTEEDFSVGPGTLFLGRVWIRPCGALHSCRQQRNSR